MSKPWQETRTCVSCYERRTHMARHQVCGDILNLDVALYCAVEWQEGTHFVPCRTVGNNRGYAYET
jgi:hypothetical protein